jgi:hypothetical protein
LDKNAIAVSGGNDVDSGKGRNKQSSGEENDIWETSKVSQ